MSVQKCQQGPTEFCQENTLVIADTLFQQCKRWFYTWTSPDGQYQIRSIVLFTAKDGEVLYSEQKQDQELTVAPLMNSLLPNSDSNERKQGIRPFRYDLNQIFNDYTVEVTNRLKGLDLIDRVPEELWTKVCDIVQEAVIKTVSKQKKCQQSKWLSKEAL